MDKNYLLNVKTKILDGRIFITGKVDTPEEKLKITKIAWETKGARSVKNDLIIKEKFNFPFELISDPEEKVCKAFDVIKEKSMYGKKYMGIERSTFLVDSKGKLKKEWRKVKVKGHVEEVLNSID